MDNCKLPGCRYLVAGIDRLAPVAVVRLQVAFVPLWLLVTKTFIDTRGSQLITHNMGLVGWQVLSWWFSLSGHPES
jgi:hypothetical protein